MALAYVHQLRAKCLDRAMKTVPVVSDQSAPQELISALADWALEPIVSAAARYKEPIYPRVNGKEANDGNV